MADAEDSEEEDEGEGALRQAQPSSSSDGGDTDGDEEPGSSEGGRVDISTGTPTPEGACTWGCGCVLLSVVHVVSALLTHINIKCTKKQDQVHILLIYLLAYMRDLLACIHITGLLACIHV